MKSLLSIKYSDAAFNIGMFVARVFLGLVLMTHGYQKLIRFPDLKNHFMNFLHLGSTMSLVLIIFAEFFCGFLIIVGLLTRLAAIPVLIGMGVVFFIAANGNLFEEGERGGIYMAMTFLILLVGPGRISLDGLLKK